MAHDALEPGPDTTYPAFPRRLDGSPAWSDSAETDGIAVPGRGPGGLVTPMPRGVRYQLVRTGALTDRIAVNVTPTGPGGVPIDPPTIP